MTAPAKPEVLLKHYLKQLKLPTFLREYEKTAAVSRDEKANYRTFLLRLCELESIDRERRAAERRIRAAGFPMIKTLDTFDFKAQASIQVRYDPQLRNLTIVQPGVGTRTPVR